MRRPAHVQLLKLPCHPPQSLLPAPVPACPPARPTPAPRYDSSTSRVLTAWAQSVPSAAVSWPPPSSCSRRPPPAPSRATSAVTCGARQKEYHQGKGSNVGRQEASRAEPDHCCADAQGTGEEALEAVTVFAPYSALSFTQRVRGIDWLDQPQGGPGALCPVPTPALASCTANLASLCPALPCLRPWPTWLVTSTGMRKVSARYLSCAACGVQGAFAWLYEWMGGCPRQIAPLSAASEPRRTPRAGSLAASFRCMPPLSPLWR